MGVEMAADAATPSPDEEALANAKTQYWPPPGEEGEFLLAVGDCSLAVLYDTLFVRSDFMVPPLPRPAAPSAAVALSMTRSQPIHNGIPWNYSPALHSQPQEHLHPKTLRSITPPRLYLVARISVEHGRQTHLHTHSSCAFCSRAGSTSCASMSMSRLVSGSRRCMTTRSASGARYVTQ